MALSFYKDVYLANYHLPEHCARLKKGIRTLIYRIRGIEGKYSQQELDFIKDFFESSKKYVFRDKDYSCEYRLIDNNISLGYRKMSGEYTLDTITNLNDLLLSKSGVSENEIYSLSEHILMDEFDKEYDKYLRGMECGYLEQCQINNNLNEPDFEYYIIDMLKQKVTGIVTKRVGNNILYCVSVNMLSNSYYEIGEKS